MSDQLYPVPQGPPAVIRPSRLLRVQEADAPPLTFKQKGILQGREQPVSAVPRPRLILLPATAAVVALVSREILRGRGGLQRGTVPDPTARRHSFFFGLPQVVTIVIPGVGGGRLIGPNRLVRGA